MRIDVSGRQVGHGPGNSAENGYYGGRNPALEPCNQHDGEKIENGNGNIVARQGVETADCQYEEKPDKREKWLGEFFKPVYDCLDPHNVRCPLSSWFFKIPGRALFQVTVSPA
jgi:hypothetical protein